MLKSSESIMVDYVVRASRAIFRFLHPPTTTTTTLLSILKFSPGQLFLKEASQEQRIIIARLVYGRQCQANNNCSFDIDYRPLPSLASLPTVSMKCFLALILLLILPTLCVGNSSTSLSWIFSCAQEGLVQDWMIIDQPIEGSVSQALVQCMVQHVMASPFTTTTNGELPLLPPPPSAAAIADGDWSCLPDNFLAESRTCASLRFDIFEPIRYCIDQENFPDLSSDTQYAQGFHTSSSSGSTTSSPPASSLVPSSSFFLSTRLATSMCALLDALRSSRGRECLAEVCRLASHSPSEAPSYQPSIPPTSAPSQTPTASPSGLPSATPSVFPSALPSAPPSLQPSTNPSSEPTRVASETPSAFPTTETLVPSAYPSLLPSWYPTPGPTETRPWGPGPFLQVKITLRVLLDGVAVRPNEEVPPLPDAMKEALEGSLRDTLRSVPGFQTVEIIAASKAAVPAHAPIVLTFRIAAMRPCGDAAGGGADATPETAMTIVCGDPFGAATIAREFRDAFAEALQIGDFARATRRQASRHNITSLFAVDPRPNSSNLMSSNSFLIAQTSSEGDQMTASSGTGFYKKSTDAILLLGAVLSGTLVKIVLL